jgi:hypothetical protein
MSRQLPRQCFVYTEAEVRLWVVQVASKKRPHPKIGSRPTVTNQIADPPW